jgi:hypothetical protein
MSSVVEVVMDPSVASMVVSPGVSPLATPLEPIVATDGLNELQLTCAVRFRVPPSLKVPTAANFWLVFCAIIALPGTIASDDKLAEFTVKGVFPLIEPDVAVILTVPRFRAVARPLAVIDETLLWEEPQATVFVMSWVVPSENVPVALNC